MTADRCIQEYQLLPYIHKIVLFDTEITKKSDVLSSRLTEHYELSFYTEGSGSFSINDNKYEIKPGAVRFTRPGDRISGTAPYICCTIFFDIISLAAATESQNNSAEILDSFPNFFYTAGNQKEAFLEALDMFYKGGSGSVFRQNALLMSILSSYYYVVNRQRGRSHSVKQCVEYIHEHYTENITLEDLSQLTNYSTLHIRRKFLSEIGMSPNELLLSVRLTKAKKLLAETKLNIIDIALQCGFSSEAYFYTVFKSQYGMTPHKFRIMMQN